MTIRQLISRLRVAQLWGVLVVIAALIGGSFSLGYKLSSSAAEVKTSKLERQVSALQENVKRFRGLESKERFLALYLRYLLAKGSLAKANTPENQETLRVSAEAFEKLILKLWQRHEEAKEELEIRGLIIGKGARATDATVKFIYDGSIWPIPPEFRVAAAKS
ncbi:MAG: hypothetical protein ACE5LX_06040 [Nitrospinota bacterium]